MSRLPPHRPDFRPPSTLASAQVATSLDALDAETGATGREPVVYAVPGWWKANDRTRVKFLRQMAEADGESPELRAWVVNTVLKPAGAAPHDHKAQAAAMLKWVQDNIYYVSEPGEQIQTVSSTLRRRFADCDDSAIVLAAMAHSVGLPFRFCLAGTGRDGKPGRWCEGERWNGVRATHIYVQLGTPALSRNPAWYSAEPTIAGLPLGHDVVLHGVPAWVRGQRADLAGSGAMGSAETVAREVAPGVKAPPDSGVTGWIKSNVDLGRVLSGVLEGTITALAIAWATERLRKG